MRTEVLVAGANDFVRKPVFRDELKARLTTLLALRDAHKLVAMHVEELEHSLVESEERARRLEALWKIANNPSLNAAEVIDAMLHQAAEAIRPGDRSARCSAYRIQRGRCGCRRNHERGYTRAGRW